jgi:hypothetical protein
MAMPDAPSETVRGVCACGQRVRIKNARPGLTIACPRCHKQITIAVSLDGAPGEFAGGLIAVCREAEELREAVPIDVGPISMARDGARPGVTGRVTYSHDDEIVASALSGGTYSTFIGTPRGPTSAAGARQPGGLPGYVRDFFLSFAFAGSVRAAVTVMVAALFFGLVGAMVRFSVASIGVFGPLLVVPMLFAALFLQVLILAFFWNILEETIAGRDDDIGLGADLDFWHSFVRPALILLLFMLALCLPGLSAWFMAATVAPASMPPIALGFFVTLVTLQVMAWFFWPLMLVSYCVGDTIAMLRPDLLVRCVIGVGLAYPVVWLLVSGIAAVWVFGGELASRLDGLFPYSEYAVAFCANFLTLYLGYALFRGIGLVYRHFRHRFPWQFE